jgi:hypothetical protein
MYTPIIGVQHRTFQLHPDTAVQLLSILDPHLCRNMHAANERHLHMTLEFQ